MHTKEESPLKKNEGQAIHPGAVWGFEQPHSHSFNARTRELVR